MGFGHLNTTRELQTSEIQMLTTTSASASEWQEALIETSKRHSNITKKAADCYDKGTGVEIECTELPKKDVDRLS